MSHVVATAGHVDHGKSSLLRALTAMSTDLRPIERDTGRTVDLGHVWTHLDDGREVSFVDVPGHRRFLANTLAGVGTSPVVMFVVAADEGWQPQSSEHLAVLAALRVRHGVLVTTKCDRATPQWAQADAGRRLAAAGLSDWPAVAVSARTGRGLAGLRKVLTEVLRRVPQPDQDAPVRLWLDRTFTVAGAGTVVTGTLPAGTVRVGDRMELGPDRRPVVVREIQRCGRAVPAAQGVSRVGLALRGLPAAVATRGWALMNPGHCWMSTCVDGWLDRPAGVDRSAAEQMGRSLGGRPRRPRLPARLRLHLGSAVTNARVRVLDADDGSLAVRLDFDQRMPLLVGDQAVLVDPGSAGERIVGRLTVVDVDPPPLGRRGAAAARASALRDVATDPRNAWPLRLRNLMTVAQSQAMTGAAPPTDALSVGGWLLDPAHRDRLHASLVQLVGDAGRHAFAGSTVPAGHPAPVPGVPAGRARSTLGLPDPRLLGLLLAPGLAVVNDLVVPAGQQQRMPPRVATALDRLRAALRAGSGFDAPDADGLRRLGIDQSVLAAARRAGQVLVLGPTVVLPVEAERAAVEVLARLTQPFTVAQARIALGTTRRVAVPLLEHLDRRGWTVKCADGGTRRLRAAAQTGAE
ncbi:SelB C-terminal domain-containing protein [Solwaraspora sp. WMMD406]|uniref:SelB domain-containing protein n=1 Tax=Solwaraspora sp. WMMD406 TaxID=3016095 RepID=UPI002415D74D|nr:SelB C-terminal domain-containing protein [Solwaraspora sp. WMMD406]MDG4763972.1 SelB C-terminal domain-containing protein [Solwaraspora sp. WMMD406]